MQDQARSSSARSRSSAHADRSSADAHPSSADARSHSRTASRRTPGQRAGDAAEALVADHLTGLGWSIAGRNIRFGRAEVDIVALDPGPPPVVVLVEVRWRSRRDFGLAEETFDRRKRGQLRSAVGRLIERGALPDGRRLPGTVVRVDLVVVEPPAGPGGPPRMRHHRDALVG
jgi:putative endonuclease